MRSLERVAGVLQAENRVYGHARVLARYAGIPGEPWIPGALQHGWNPYDGIGAFDGLWRSSLPKFTWSQRAADRGRELGGVRYTAIGAPWLYLLTQFPQAMVHTPEPSTLVYPDHATVHDKAEADHAAFARAISEYEAGTKVVVCLHPIDYRAARVRAAYEDAGFPVVSNGGSSALDPAHSGFLDRQLETMSQFSRVVSNRLSTAVLYAAAAGRRVGIYGPDMTRAGERPYSQSEVPRLWPDLHHAYVDAETASAVANAELGAESLRSPDELRELFRWTARGLPVGNSAAYTARRARDLWEVNLMWWRRGIRGFRAY